MIIKFCAIGQAQPAGSKRAFVFTPKNGGKPRASVSDANAKSKPWQWAVAMSAREVYHGPLLTEPLDVTITFYRPRPRGHYGSGKNAGTVKASAPAYPGTKPDLLKLARGIEDALSKVVYVDDALIVDEHLFKRWGEPARVEVQITEAREGVADFALSFETKNQAMANEGANGKC